MEATDLVLAFIVMFCAAAIQGAVGFGANLLAAPLLLIIDPLLVPVPILISALVMNALVLRRDRHPEAWATVRLAIGFQVVGAIGGAALVWRLPVDRLSVIFALLILVAVVVSASGLRPQRSAPTLALGGAAAGFMGTTTGIGGPPIALVLQDLPGFELRAALARFFIVGGLCSLAALAVVGEVTGARIVAGLLLSPGIIAGFMVSRFLARHVDRGRARGVVLLVSAISALIALGRALAV